ncbi:MAG TPA: acetyl-CoA carboxylase biotin carboxyl carrier protein subunit [Polyangiaceae bacterium]|nr:acetyl-CoA carboxylase biotin carboxyl carrier protein subunit [Polyangiaceae bacterium]
MKKLRITVNDRVYECTVEVLEDDDQQAYPGATGALPAPAAALPAPAARPAAAPAPAAKPAGGAAPKGDANAILAPIAGTVQKVFVKEGATVEEKAPVVMLDAMKMDTYIYASRAGTIAEVCVKVGETVQVGQAIVRYRTEA